MLPLHEEQDLTIQSPTMTSTSHFAKDRMALCLSVKPPDEPAMRIGRFVAGVSPFAEPLTAVPLLRRALFAALGAMLRIGLGRWLSPYPLGGRRCEWRGEI